MKILSLLLTCLLLIACQTTPSEKPSTPQTVLQYIDSTVYFADKTASISMRASFSKQEQGANQKLAKGYQLQLRSIRNESISIQQLSIIAGGQKIAIADDNLIIQPRGSVNISLEFKDTTFISQQTDALLRFKYNGESQFVTVSNHKLSRFLVF